MKKRLIVTVHGIRTFGGWQERWEALYKREVSPNERVDFVHYKYGYFSIISFIIPLTRFLAVALFNKYMKEHYDKGYDVIDFYGHSFGTHLIAHGLKKQSNRTMNVGTLFLTGSVLRTNFPWSNLRTNRPSRVVNDCGNTDTVLLLNQFAVLLSGMAGRVGLNGGMTRHFRNRFHNFGHSGYFQNKEGNQDNWMRKFWVPLAKDDERAIEPYDERPELNWIRGLFLALVDYLEPIKVLIYSIPVGLFAATYYALYGQAVIAQVTAENNLQKALVGQSSLLRSQALHQDAAKITAEIYRGSLRNLKSRARFTSEASQAIYHALHNPLEVNFVPIRELVELDENEPWFSGPLYTKYGDELGQFRGVNGKWTRLKPKTSSNERQTILGSSKLIDHRGDDEGSCGGHPKLSDATDVDVWALGFDGMRNHFSSVQKLNDRLYLTAQAFDAVAVSIFGSTSRDDCGFNPVFRLDEVINLTQNDPLDLGFAEYHVARPWILRRSWQGVHTYSLAYAPPAFVKSHNYELDNNSEIRTLKTWVSEQFHSKHGYTVAYNPEKLTLEVKQRDVSNIISLANYHSTANYEFSPSERQQISLVMARDMLAVLGHGVGVIFDLNTKQAKSIFHLLEKPFSALRQAREPIPTDFSLSPKGDKFSIAATADASGQRYLFVLERDGMNIITHNLMDSFSGKILPEETSGQDGSKFRYVFSRDGNWLVARDNQSAFQSAAWRIFPDSRDAMIALINQLRECFSTDLRRELGLQDEAPKWCSEVRHSKPI